jgi:hypothetical protein
MTDLLNGALGHIRYPNYFEALEQKTHAAKRFPNAAYCLSCRRVYLLENINKLNGVCKECEEGEQE